MQTTLVLIKPDGVARGLIGEILRRFEAAQLRVVDLKFLQPSVAQAAGHYVETREQLEGMGAKLRAAAADANFSLMGAFGTEDSMVLGRKIFEGNVAFLCSGPVVVVVLEGHNAIRKARALCGSTLPSDAAPGTIRGDLSANGAAQIFEGASTVANLVHSSDEDAQYESATREIAHWFRNVTDA